MRFTFDPPEIWSLNAQAHVEANPSAPSQPNALRLVFGGFDPAASHVLSGLILGQDYPVFARCNFDGVDAGDVNTINVSLQYLSTVFANLYKDPVATGWELRDCGMLTYGAAGFPSTADGLFRIVGHQNFNPGTVLIDTIYIGELPPELQGFEMSKRREIREAMVARVGTVLVSNGYALSIGEAVTGPMRVPTSVQAWPHVQIRHGEEIKVVDAFTTKNVGAQFRIGVFCKKSETTNPDDECEDGCAEIEKALELFEDGQWLGLGYIENVFVSGIDPEELPPEVGSDVRLWVMTVDVTYNHDRRDP
jgi:hypothetical protein